MSEENLQRARQNCCRLCLAPDSECISILNSYAADKEPLSTKIHNCVSIKITSTDSLSVRICHACISYLNSWQSFKNRCVAAQGKQRNWLEFGKRQQLLENNVSISTITTTAAQRQQKQQQQQQQHDQDSTFQQQDSNLASSILDGITSLKKRKSLTVYPLPAINVKDEPLDEDDYNAMKQHDESDEMVDPTLFLERNDDEGAEIYMEGSNYYDQTHHGNNSMQPDRTTIEIAAAVEVKEASCRACNLKFSTRANARRHERNLHPNLFELSSSTPKNAAVTKPTATLVASLELQRAALSAAAEAAKNVDASMTTTQKLRQDIVNAANSTETCYDYDSPERYQDLLTDEKIIFLQQNEEFLQQYQTMTCKCCRKYYTSYKNFMQHMRKKYVTLPRNLCFNCLKLNDSKALFISHLKKRNCINLYKVMHALMAKAPSFAAAVAATTAAMPEKLRAKELLVNKIYECKLCTKHFRLKLEFRSHVYDVHADAQKKDVSPGQCGFCGLEFEDPLERKRHYNNMDCIVTLRCVTCDEKFGNHQKFLDHVYARHLVPGGGVAAAAVSSLVPAIGGTAEQQRKQQQLASADNSPGKKSNTGFAGTSSADESRSSNMQPTVPKSQYFSRMPQACPICGQQYNNYNNVLRHMESKHPDQLPQTYKCVKCGIGYPRLSNLREHMLTTHEGKSEKQRATSFEYIVNADAVKSMEGAGGGAGAAGGGPGSSTGGAYTGRYDYVMKDLMSITNGGTMVDDEDDEDDGGEHTPLPKKIRLDSAANHSGSSATGAAAAGAGGASNSSMYSSYKECPICSAIFSNNIGLSNHMRSHTSAAQSAAAAAAVAAATAAEAAAKIAEAKLAAAANAGAGKTPAQQQAIFKRSLELAADRRFRRMRCRICQKRFSSKKSYRRHMLDDHQIRNVQFIKCKLCDAEFAYEKGLKVHMFKIHNTLLKDEMIIKQYECDICSIVYRTEQQLLAHKKNIHGNENAHPDDFEGEAAAAMAAADVSAVSGVDISTANLSNATQLLDNSAAAVATAPLYWYQCKYCASNFNTNKKLAIHINSHDEFDSNDYSCKDCGNVYSGRKSLWVHRYKKHPQIAEPSECVLCRKVFFDSQMLENHIPTCNRKPITATGAMAEHALPAALNTFYRHKTGDDEDDDDDGGGSHNAGDDETGVTTKQMKIKLPEVACTICGQRFTDQELFAKHIQMHEMELYTDNPLAAMFDTGPADPNQFYLDRVNDNGEYACDICPKTFTQMTALKVHRKWHFRGDSKQNPVDGDHHSAFAATSQTHNLPHQLGLQAVGLMPKPHNASASHQQTSRTSMKRKRELKCQYCPSTFISNNNLRRHIYELHKTEIANWPAPPTIDTDTYLHCRKCALKFETKQEWIDHKVADARINKPYGPFQWGCELCGEYVSRKEKLIHHIQSHMKEQVVPVQQRQQQEAAAAAAASTSQTSSSNDKNNAAQEAARENYAAESNSQDSQQSEEAEIKMEFTVDEEDDVAVEYVMDEEENDVEVAANAEVEEKDDDTDDDEEDDEDDEGEEDDDEDDDDDDDEEEEEQHETRGGGDDEVDEEEDEEEAQQVTLQDADDETIENIDDNANDGQNGNAEQQDEEEDEDMDDDHDDADGEEDADIIGDEDTNESKRKFAHKSKRNAAAAEDSNTFDDDDDYDGGNVDDEEDGEETNGNAYEDAEAMPVNEDDYIEEEHVETTAASADEEDDELIIEEDDDEEEEEQPSPVKQLPPAVKTRFACDLCQVFFDTQQELQKHVKIHFLNGPGSVTLTEIRGAKAKSRSSGSSDAVTVSSS